MRNDTNRLMLVAAVGAALAAASSASAQDPQSTWDRTQNQAQQSAEQAGDEVRQGAASGAAATDRALDRTGDELERGADRLDRTTGSTVDRSRATSDAPERDRPRTPAGETARDAAQQQPESSYAAPSEATRTATADRDESRGGNVGADWVLVPRDAAAATRAVGSTQGDGCWVRLYTDTRFEGQSITIVGPGAVQDLRAPFGVMRTSWQSAIVGPTATVSTYENEDLRDRDKVLSADQRYEDLGRAGAGFFRNVQSIRLTCQEPAGGVRQAEAPRDDSTG